MPGFVLAAAEGAASLLTAGELPKHSIALEFPLPGLLGQGCAGTGGGCA